MEGVLVGGVERWYILNMASFGSTIASCWSNAGAIDALLILS